MTCSIMPTHTVLWVSLYILLQEAQQSLVLYEQQYKEYEEKDQALRRDDNTLRQEKVCILPIQIGYCIGHDLSKSPNRIEL